ncbi:hypothetical protein H4R18_000121 [Coemansia javaensis]|uniref:Uncharacterized protein n=1 Tax=Coemansia javaensis TaxID=2761396 RepID=A0A9W8HHP5_9FUNG|nr:hypothetical protein H4R18_000121 [Coemansia javaensis]
MGRRVAVVGSGLAGLATAHMLQTGGCEVELFERADSVGMDAGSLTVDGVRVDVPFRVMTPDYYPYLHALYGHLGIKFAAADYSMGFADEQGEPVWSYVNRPLGCYVAPIPDDVRRGARLAITRDWVRLAFACVTAMRAPALLRPGGRLSHMTIGQYLSRERYDRVFVDRVFVPFIASMLTCSISAATAYPATTIMHLVAKVLCGGRVRKARDGVQEVCALLTRGLDNNMHLGAQIDRLVLAADNDDDNDNDNAGGGSTDGRRVMLATADGKERWFDDVVLATPADTAARLLAGAQQTKRAARRAPGAYPPGELLDALRSVPYEDTSVFTHRDAAVMPARRAEWRGVNIRTAPGENRAMASHWINYVEQTSASGRVLGSDVFQTVDPLAELDPAKVISTTTFHRSLVTIESQAHINTVHRHQGRCGVWLVGTYTAPGVPLLEGCVRTAVDVVRAIVGDVPFDAPRMLRAGKGGGAPYEVGLAPGMARGEIVEAYFECDAAGTFAFARPPLAVCGAGLGAWLQAWALWLGFTVLLPLAALLSSAGDAVARAALGPDFGLRLQLVALDILIYAAWAAQAAYRWLTAQG